MRNLKLRRRQGFSSSQLSAVSTVVSPLAGGVIAGLVVVVMLSPIAISQEPAQNTSGLTDTARTLGAGTKSNEEIIRDLIEKLGSDSYATRVRARDQLKSFGLEAFDALREAQKHNDSEVQTAARYLHKSLQVRWSNESDPKQVQEILFEYGAQSTTDRLARIELLGRLPDFMGGEALARLARFDQIDALSRRAAMLILKQPLPGDQEKRQTLIDQILSVIGDNERDPIEWLRAYVDDLRAGQFDAKRWQSVVDDQRRQVDMGINSDVTADSVLQLIKVIATRAIDEDARPSALSIVIDNLDLVSPSTHELANQTDWAISHELYPIVTELYDRHRHSFSMNAELLYSAAQAFRDSGNAEKGQRLAFDAFNINALPVVDEKQPKDDDKDSEDQRKLTDHQLEDIAFSHFSVAIQLEKRGQFDWEEREFRAIMANCDIETNVGVRARIKLASLFANQLRHEEAVQTLAVICDRIDRDKEYVRKLMIYEILSQFVQSEFYYQSALAILAKDALTDSEMTEAKENLRKAYVFDNRNVDILIRMFRFDDPSDPEWRRGVRERISQYVQNLDRTIVQYEASKSLARDDRYKELLGEKYNEYAWLVANTEGDLERALQCSLRSLSFVTADDVDRRAARLDTCARCYYALGQFEKAIATQKEALELERYSFPMLRQLAEFESALQAEKKENGS